MVPMMVIAMHIALLPHPADHILAGRRDLGLVTMWWKNSSLCPGHGVLLVCRVGI